VGTINLSVAGCLNFYTHYFSGSFTITTGVGTLSGSASGPESTTGTPPSIYDEFPLDLTATTGTGSFAGTTGSVQAVLYASTDLTTFQGIVTNIFTQVLIPQGGTISGVTYLDALAYDAPGVRITKVVFEINDQVVATATPTYYGWLAQWNTAGVASGIYDLMSVATDANGNTLTSFPMTILVENPMPTTAVLIPSSGAILSGGSSVLDATASSPDGAAINVKFTLTGGSLGTVIGTATPTIYGYILVWNSTTVPNGTYTLQSLVTDVAGNFTYSTGISVTVANPPPTTAILIPSSGTGVSGISSLLDASASANVTYVIFELSGGTLSDQLIATATPTYYGWLAQWNTNSVPNGTYTLQSVASYSRYFASSGTSAPVTITVAN
jgi:large repetitive protein